MKVIQLTKKRFWGMLILATLPFFAKAQMYVDVEIDQTGVEACIESSINALHQLNNLEISPNPATTSINLSWTDTQLEGRTEVVIFNHLGQMVYTQSVIKNGSFSIDIDVTGLAKGIYFIKVSCNNSNAIQKLIIE